MDYSDTKQITPFNRRFQQAIITLPIPDVHDYKWRIVPNFYWVYDSFGVI